MSESGGGEPSRDFSSIRSVLATDCGSTTTKAILIEKQEDGTFRLVTRGEAPTTVEAPFEDVTKGVLNAAQEVEELRGRPILDGHRIRRPQEGDAGVDIYISTSSAGGGLQMMVAGVVRSMTAESAARAALGAGAIVMDVIASNDRRLPHEKIERIRQLRPDMILLAGGVDGGTVTHVVELAELFAAANPRPRLGIGYKLPVVYAGNKKARKQVQEILGDKVELSIVDNIRPVLEEENLGPAREKIHDLFMEHVMAQAPGYAKLMEMADAPIMPTPGAVGLIMQAIAKRDGINIVGVDIGGATTDVFSVFEVGDEEKKQTVFNRTVSANLGMSYSVSNVLAEAGLPNILRWVPFDIDETDLRNRIGNKMIRPTTIPQALEELKIEQAICREALRLAFIQHRDFAVGLKGVQKERTVSEAFSQDSGDESIVQMMKLDLIVGSGGVLCHAPRRSQSFMMMMDAYAPEGITELSVDSIFMMPHLGVLSTVNEKAATDVFEKDCLVRLGTCIAPVAKRGKKVHEGEVMAEVEWEAPDGRSGQTTIRCGEIQRFEVPYDAEAKTKVRVTPHRRFDVGGGHGVPVEREINGGLIGLVTDGRGRPLVLPSDHAERIRKLDAWNRALDVYPE
ncbi:MAG: methylaspartate mutase [Deltaproteobacteria bacterium]|nr:MAG: methylaspartate mutase [Deltaproteobacteria bacterium]